MRSPFDTSDAAWWAVHGASMPAPPPSSVELDPIEALADELLAMPASNASEASVHVERNGLSLEEYLEATERDTSRSSARPPRSRP